MRALVLLMPLLLAGCTFGGSEGGGEESAEETFQRDVSGYDGGIGIGFSLRNDGASPFNVTVVATDDNGTQLARFAAELAPNATREGWFSVGHDQFNVTMEYTSRSPTGGVRTGDDERRVDLRGCPVVSVLGWRFIEADRTVGAAFTGVRCMDAP